MAQHFADEERVALGLTVQRVREVEAGRVEIVAGRLRHQARDLAFVEPLEIEPLHTRFAPEVGEHLSERMRAVEVGVAVRREHEQPHRSGRAQQMTQQHERRLVGPVHVVEHEHDGMARGDLAEQVGDAVEQAEALGVGVGAHRLGQPGDARRELGHDAHELTAERTELGVHAVGRRRGDVVAQCFGERAVRRTELFVATAPQHDRAALVRDAQRPR